MTNAAQNSGLTIGTGGGGSIGAGVGLGLNFSASAQLVATPNGEVGIAITGGFGPFMAGFGAIAGGQVSISNAQNLNDLRGQGLDFGASGGAAYGAGLDYTQNYSGSVRGGSLTVGPAAGGKISTGATYTHTWVPSFLSANCKG